MVEWSDPVDEADRGFRGPCALRPFRLGVGRKALDFPSIGNVRRHLRSKPLAFKPLRRLYLKVLPEDRNSVSQVSPHECC